MNEHDSGRGSSLIWARHLCDASASNRLTSSEGQREQFALVRGERRPSWRDECGGGGGGQ